MKKRIVITGAAGGVIGRVLPELRKEYDLVLLDLYDTDGEGRVIEGIHKVDLVNPDRDTYREYFKGADAVMHTAYLFSQRIDTELTRFGPEAFEYHQFKRATDDIQMAYNVYKTAQEEGVKRVIVFSSNHATDYYEQLLKKGVMESVDEDVIPYSDTFYGWSKVCEEAMGHLFAATRKGRRLEIIMIRLGAPRTDLIDRSDGGDHFNIRRRFASYLGVKDELKLLKLCVEKENIDDKNGVPFLLFYATSDNHNRIWSLRDARLGLGFEPEENSYHLFSERIKKIFVENIDSASQEKRKV